MQVVYSINGGLLPDIILLTLLCHYIGESFSYHEEFLSLHPMFPPKYFDNFSPEGGCSEGLDEFRFTVSPSKTLPRTSLGRSSQQIPRTLYLVDCRVDSGHAFPSSANEI